MRCPLLLLRTSRVTQAMRTCEFDCDVILYVYKWLALRFFATILHIAHNIASPFLCVRTFSPGFGNSRCFPKYYPICYSALFCCSFSQFCVLYCLSILLYSILYILCALMLFALNCYLLLHYFLMHLKYVTKTHSLSTLLCLWVFRKFAMHQVAQFFLWSLLNV